MSSGAFTEAPGGLPPAGTAHQPVRPEWGCSQGCGGWPCEPAKADLLAEFAADRVALSVQMATRLHEAVDDLWAEHPDGPKTGPEELFERFVLWTRPKATAPAGRRSL